MLSSGDINFYRFPGQSEPHHVVIHLGGERILEALQTGDGVRYRALSELFETVKDPQFMSSGGEPGERHPDQVL